VVKILSQAGNSLADIYDVEGSVAGIEQLETRELPIMHEMGGTVFSERLAGSIRRGTTAALNQSTPFDVTLAGLPQGIFRILGITVLATSGRTSHASVALRSVVQEREIPVFIWDNSDDQQSTIRLQDDGGAASDHTALIPSISLLPNLAIGRRQLRSVGDEIVFRGSTNAFGAGTNTLVVLVYQAFTDVGSNIAPRGLPVPAW